VSARRHALHRRGLLGVDRPLAVERDAQRVHDPAEQLGADRDLHDAARRLDQVALLEVLVVAHDHRADLVLLQVQGHAVNVARELQQLARHRLAQAVDGGDAVADGDDPAHLGRDQLGLEVLEPRLDDVGDVLGTDAHLLTPFATGLFFT
jgi:hypothetical protein